jgi:pilus assembly protein CpaE
MPRQVSCALLGVPLDVARHVQGLLGDRLLVGMERENPSEALAGLVPLQPQAVLLFIGRDRRIAMQFARRIRHDLPTTSLILLSESDDVELTREAVRLGARAMCVVRVDDRELVQLFDAMALEEHDSKADGMVVALMGAKGGMGTTSLAINLAGLLAEDPNKRVALVDLALFIGEVGVYLDMETPYSLADVVRDLSRLSERWVEQHVPRHDQGFYVLSQPAQVDDFAAVKVSDVVQALSAMKAVFTHVVLDAGAQMSEAGLAGVHAADQTLLITTQELPAIVSTRRRIALLTQLGGDQTRVRLVVNRFQANSGHSRQRIESYTGHGVNATVRNDYPHMSAAIDQGKLLATLAPNAGVTQDIRDLIQLFDSSASSQQRTRKRLFGLF